MSRRKYLWCRVIAEPDSLEIVMVVFRKCYGVTLDCGSAWTVRKRGTVSVLDCASAWDSGCPLDCVNAWTV